MNFWKNKRVFVTGHTGFKGSWLSLWLSSIGAEVCGYALSPPSDPALFHIVGLTAEMEHHTGDIRDFERLLSAMRGFKPDIVLHMAAQPIVRDSYVIPRDTYEINVMGTVCVLDAVRQCDSVKAVLNVTTDKVYENLEVARGYVEGDALGGYDPYSNSKACSELVTAAYKTSFLNEKGVHAATARAGNVIGGGDFAPDRLIPDCVRSVMAGRPIYIRNPHSVRPWQHVLEPLKAYLLLAEKLYTEGAAFAESFNIGPSLADCCEVGEVVTLFCEVWGGAAFELAADSGPHEAGLLMLNCEKAHTRLGWSPRWAIRDAIENTVIWTRTYIDRGDVRSVMLSQINEYN